MKLYDFGRAPNPRRVRIFLAEKGINIPTEQVDLGALQQKSESYTAINPLQRVPALVLDDGTVITELIAICRYFEVLNPEPPLFGRGARDSALIEMWNRRAEFHLYLPVSSVFRHLHPGAKGLEDRRCRHGARPTSRASSSSCNCSTASSSTDPMSPARNFRSPTSPRWCRSIS